MRNGTIVITSEQTQGRGQRGNQWLTQPYKNLTFSLVMDVSMLNPAAVFNLNMIISLGVLHSLRKLNLTFAGGFTIKWPNDYYFNTSKIGGMLIETLLKADQSFWAVIGIGLNINQSDFGRLNATSLININNEASDLNDILNEICVSIEKEIDANPIGDFERLKSIYLQNLYKYGVSANFKKNADEELLEGKIIDVDASGKIGISSTVGIQYFDKQQIKFLPGL